ncbi:MAG: hypothetical protein ABW170_16845 [Candidatus Thiodiazotropha sp. L084R]
MPHPFIDQLVSIIPSEAATQTDYLFVGRLKASDLRDLYFLDECHAVTREAMESGALKADEVTTLGALCVERPTVALMTRVAPAFYSMLKETVNKKIKDKEVGDESGVNY